MNGLLSRDAKKQLDKFQEFASLNKVLPLTINAARLAAKIASDLRKKGNTVEHPDLLIAGIALDHNMQLATNNSKHFQRIEGLELVSWMEPDSPSGPYSGSILDYVA